MHIHAEPDDLLVFQGVRFIELTADAPDLLLTVNYRTGLVHVGAAGGTDPDWVDDVMYGKLARLRLFGATAVADELEAILVPVDWVAEALDRQDTWPAVALTDLLSNTLLVDWPASVELAIDRASMLAEREAS